MPDNTKIDTRYAGEQHRESQAPRIHGVVVTPVQQHVDDRQSLMVYLKDSDPFFAGFTQSYVTISSRGIVKAWHYHLKQTDIWFVPHGKIKVGLFDAREDSPTSGVANSLVMGGGNTFTLAIPPGVFHGYVTLTEEAILINTTNQPYSTDDEYRAAWDDPRFGFDWSVQNR